GTRPPAPPPLPPAMRRPPARPCSASRPSGRPSGTAAATSAAPPWCPCATPAPPTSGVSDVRRRLLLILILLAPVALSGCARCRPVVIREPVDVPVYVRVVEPIPDELLREHPADEAPGS